MCNDSEYNEDNDLFVHYESMPEELSKIIDSYSDEEGSIDHEDGAKLLAEIKPLGFTCDYYMGGSFMIAWPYV